VVISAGKSHLAQHRDTGLLPPPDVTRLPTAPRTRLTGAGVIGEVGVEPSFDRVGGKTKRLPPQRRLHRLEIQTAGCPLPYERLDFGEDLPGERGLEFFLPSTSRSASCSQTRMYRCANSLNRLRFSVSS